ncbi:NUDIX hydrolase [Candidatus Saccharibacteria bacterium]|nr:NUDIX hydrolase [Candidatus Saccharibacteria bacterium]
MKDKTIALVGRILYFLAWPALYIYLKIGIRTRVIVSHNDRVLVVKNLIGDGKWSLPGGGVHKGEDSRVGACRELLEETGITIEPSQLEMIGQASANLSGLKFTYDQYFVELRQKPEIKKQALELTGIAWVKLESLNPGNSQPDVIETLRAWKH